MIVRWRTVKVDEGKYFVIFARTGDESFSKGFGFFVFQRDGAEAVEQVEVPLF